MNRVFTKQSKWCILTVLFFSVPFLACGQYIKKAQLEDDLKEFERLLFTLHPGLDYFTDTLTLRNLFVEKKANLPDSLDRISFFNHIEPIIGNIRCGHTNLAIANKLFKKPEDKKKKLFFPALMYPWDGRLFFQTDFKHEWLTIPKGTELISIDSIPSAEIIHQISKTHKGADGQDFGSETAWSVAGFRTTYNRFFGRRANYKIVVRKPGKQEIDLYTLKGISYESIAKERKENKRSPLSYEFIEGGQVAVIKLTSFSNESFFKRNKKLFKEAFKEIKEKNVQNLIIDLRNNGGGAIVNCNHFLSYLLEEEFTIVKRASLNKHLNKKDLITFQKVLIATRKKELTSDEIWLKKYNRKAKKINKQYRYDGKLVVLTNKRSYSASTMFCAKLKSEKRGVIMGEVPGGSYHISFAGYSKYFTMKNSKIRIRIPLMRMEYDVDSDLQDNMIPVQPDIIKAVTEKDLIDDTHDSLKQDAIEYLLNGKSM